LSTLIHSVSDYTVDGINGTMVGDCHCDAFFVKYCDIMPTLSGGKDYNTGDYFLTMLLAKSPPRLVHLDKSMTGGGRLISVAISPGTKDRALGLISGHIDILYDVFEYVSNRLDGWNQGGGRYAGGIFVRRITGTQILCAR
jgi:hypothetical protein